jgi:cytochrome c oxidase subunit 2
MMSRLGPSVSPARALAAAGLVWAASVVAGHPAQDQPLRVVDVVARRFAFEPPVVTVAVGERVRLVVTSADGVHGIEIRQFKVKQEVPRGGQPVIVEFAADTPGRFPIVCSEYCGTDHDMMKGTLVVEAADGGR